MPGAAWCRVESAGADIALTLTIHAQPRARRSEVGGVHGDALKVRLAAPAVEGKANDALLRLLADAFGVPLRQVTLLRGDTARRKLVRIEAPTQRPDRTWASAGQPPEPETKPSARR